VQKQAEFSYCRKFYPSVYCGAIDSSKATAELNYMPHKLVSKEQALLMDF